MNIIDDIKKTRTFIKPNDKDCFTMLEMAELTGIWGHKNTFG